MPARLKISRLWRRGWYHWKMRSSQRHRNGGIALVSTLAAATLIVHILSGGRYGFHRDELATLDDARHLAWGYVAYPPATPFFGWLSLHLFGTSLTGFRFFAACAASGGIVLTGLMARELGGGRAAILLAAFAATPFALAMWQSDAIRRPRLSLLDQRRLFLRSSLQIGRSALVAAARCVHRNRHAYQVQHAFLCSWHCRRCGRHALASAPVEYVALVGSCFIDNNFSTEYYLAGTTRFRVTGISAPY